MNAKILCNWLGTTDWPPDHYTLLGLKAGEGDVARIEHQVHERMAKLRCYQLSHPDEATEGMNRLAQAFINLTESLSRPGLAENGCKKPATKEQATVALAETQRLVAAGNKTEIDWKNTPPPVRAVAGSDSVSAVAAPPVGKLIAPVKPAAPVAELAGAIHELAYSSPEACRGLGTLPALIERISLTRKLICSWKQAGKYLSNTAKKLTRLHEENDLTRRLNKIFELTTDFPKIVGHPGQPGYRVVAMARLEMTAQMFKMLDKEQRADLARDWESGYRVLLCHRRFLRSQFKSLRRRGLMPLLLRATRGVINDHSPLVWAGVVVVIGLCAYFYWKVL